VHTGARDVRIGLLVLAAALGCSQQIQKAPPPEIDRIEPALIAPGTTSLYIDGKALALEGAQPSTLRVHRIEDLDGQPVTDPDLVAELLPISEDFAGVTLTILDDTPPGIYGIRLVRGDGQSVETRAFVRLPAPGPATPDALSLCMNPDPATVGISGSDFLVIGAELPRVTFKPHQNPSQGSLPPQPLTPKVSGCKRIPFGPEDGGVGATPLQRCSRLDIQLPLDAPVHDLPPEAYEVEIGQPGFYAGNLPTSKVKLILDRPLTYVVDIFLLLSAVDAPRGIDVAFPEPNVWWAPPGWHRDDEAPPTAVIDGQPIPLVTSGCAPTDIPGHSWCSHVAVTLPQGFPPGTHTLSVTTTPGCTSSIRFHNVGRPNVSSVGPSPLCTHGRERFQVIGTGFEDPQIFIGGQQLTTVTACPSPSDPCTLLALPPGTLSPGQYPVTIQNNSFPPVMAVPSPVVTIASGPPQLTVPEPSVVYGGADREVAILFAFPSTSPITAAGLGSWGSREISIPTQFTAFDGGVRLVVPGGTPEGVYAAVVTEGGVCTGGDPWTPVWVKADWKVMGDDFDAGIDFRDQLEVVWKTIRNSGDPTTLATWQPTGGNPGGAASFAFDAGMPTWYFGFGLNIGWDGEDLSTLGFDLRLVRSSGAPVTAPDVRILSNGIELQRSLGSSPDGTWKHYVVALDTPAGWTYVDGSGSRPATLTDLHVVRDSAYGLWIRGLYADGAGETWIDNVLVDRHH
jgi:hypothetical protein